MKRLAWRGVNNRSAWFHHPRAFWTIETSHWAYKVPLRRRWYLAIHDPIYVAMWIVLIAILVTVAVLAL